MASRLLLSTAFRRGFQTSARRFESVATTTAAGVPGAGAAAAPLPARKPVGAFRGGLFGFFFGSTLAGGAVYYYALQEYKASNELLTEDIYALQNAVDRLSKYLVTLEEKMEVLERKRK